MNKILIVYNIKNFRVFYCSVPKTMKLIRKDKVKEFVKVLQSELAEIKSGINKKDSKEKLRDFKQKYFMINNENNIIEYDFFNDEIIHHKLINFLNEKKEIENISLFHEIEVMENILQCYYDSCSLNIDYSDMSFKKNEQDEMEKIISHYENKFLTLKENIRKEKNVTADGKNLIDEMKCLLILASKIRTKTSTILFSQILVNNILRAFIKIFYDENIEYLDCTNRFFLTNVKESEYFKNILSDSIKKCEEIIFDFSKEFEDYTYIFPEFKSIKNDFGQCIDTLASEIG